MKRFLYIAAIVTILHWFSAELCNYGFHYFTSAAKNSDILVNPNSKDTVAMRKVSVGLFLSDVEDILRAPISFITALGDYPGFAYHLLKILNSILWGSALSGLYCAQTIRSRGDSIKQRT